MGQTVHKDFVVQRIRPTPGSSGLRLRNKNTISIYSEITHSIYPVKVNFGMRIDELKRYIKSGDSVQLKLNNQIIKGNPTLNELGLSEISLLKAVPIEKSLSTFDLSKECLDNIKSIGPKPIEAYKPTQPLKNNTSTATDLSIYAVTFDLVTLIFDFDLALKSFYLAVF